MDKNAANAGVISAEAGRVCVRVIRTGEELMIARSVCRALALGLASLLSPAYAQEKIVDKICVELGIISWTDIEKELKGKPKTHTEEYHIKMAKKMAAMHGGGVKDEYHILIVLIDRSSNTQIGDAHVEVTAKAKTALEQVTHKLQPMTMNNFSGYGKYFRLSYHVPYIFEVKFSLKGQEKVYTVEFERSP